MSSRNKPTMAGMICGSAIIATLAVIAPLAAHAQSKPTVTVVNPVSSPVNARITNTVVPVTISNADPIPVQVQVAPPPATTLASFRGFQATFGTADGGDKDVLEVNDAILLNGVTMQINAGGTAGECRFTLVVTDSNDVLITALASIHVFAGRSLSSPAIPLPNLALPVGLKIRYLATNTTGVTCDANILLYMTRA